MPTTGTAATLRSSGVTRTTEKGGQRRPSEYLFDWGTNGTSIYMYRVIITRPVTSAASTQPPLFLAVFGVYHLLITSHF